MDWIFLPLNTEINKTKQRLHSYKRHIYTILSLGTTKSTIKCCGDNRKNQLNETKWRKRDRKNIRRWSEIVGIEKSYSCAVCDVRKITSHHTSHRIYIITHYWNEKQLFVYGPFLFPVWTTKY